MTTKRYLNLYFDMTLTCHYRLNVKIVNVYFLRRRIIDDLGYFYFFLYI